MIGGTWMRRRSWMQRYVVPSMSENPLPLHMQPAQLLIKAFHVSDDMFARVEVSTECNIHDRPPLSGTA